MAAEDRQRRPQEPLLLLDIDGVLSPFEGTLPSSGRIAPDGFRQVRLTEGAEQYLWVSEANAERLRRLEELFEIVWATGWGDRANRVIGPLHGLEELPVVELEFSEGPTWKLPSVSSYVGDDRPCAWIDDDLRDDAVAWAEQRPGPTLLARCEPHIGLTDEIVDLCLEFARTHADGDARRRV